MTISERAIPVSDRVYELLLEREGQVLRWSLAARLIFVGVIIALTILQLLRITPPGIVAQQDSDAIASLAICVATVSVIGWFYRTVGQGRYIRTIGLTVIAVDLTVLAILPWIWLNAVPGLVGFPPGLVKGDLYGIALLMMIINSITLRPLNPALMSTGSLIVIMAVAGITLRGPDAVMTLSYVDHFKTPAVNSGLIITRCLILFLAGAFLTAMTYSVRQTMRDTISLQLANLDLKERQAELALEGRLASIKGLVAGLAHELNTPLGVLSSSLGTLEAGVRRLLSDESQPSDQTERARRALVASTATAQQGLDRIQSLVGSLKDFSRLDESQTQRADLRTELDTVLTLIDPKVVGQAEIVKEYGEIDRIECRPRELNQAFLTILVNAFEAIGGTGRLRIEVRRAGENVQVSIEDSGPGIAPEILPHLFDVTFTSKGERVAMRMGLPAARLIVERHSGRIQVSSAPGAGARFDILLPA